jgi:hypothetical protein
MGSYGIGSGRLLACIAEEHHDDKGLIWPITVAPYHVHLVSLGQPEAADRIYEALLKAGIEVLYDDREESPGVKFNDADLIGIPLRVTVAAKSLAKGGVELKRRDQPKAESLRPIVARVGGDQGATRRDLKVVECHSNEWDVTHRAEIRWPMLAEIQARYVDGTRQASGHQRRKPRENCDRIMPKIQPGICCSQPYYCGLVFSVFFVRAMGSRTLAKIYL